MIIGIQHKDEVACGLRQTQIARYGLTAIAGRLHHDNVRKTRGIFLQNLPRAVGRAIVDADVLHVVPALCNDRVETLVQIRRSVVNGGENGERHRVGAG